MDGGPVGGEWDCYGFGKAVVGAVEVSDLQGVAIGEDKQLVVGAGVGKKLVWVVGEMQQSGASGGWLVGGGDGWAVGGWAVEGDGCEGDGSDVSGTEYDAWEIDFSFGGEAF